MLRPDKPSNAGSEAVPELAAIYDQHFDYVWGAVRRLGVPSHSVEDAVQDVFLTAHRRLGDFEGRSTIKTWLFGIALRVARDHRRRVQRKGGLESLPEGLADPGETPLASVERAESLRLLHRLLADLDADKREVFVMIEMEEMSAPQVADLLETNLNTVYSRARAARAQFDRALSRHRARDRS